MKVDVANLFRNSLDIYWKFYQQFNEGKKCLVGFINTCFIIGSSYAQQEVYIGQSPFHEYRNERPAMQVVVENDEIPNESTLSCEVNADLWSLWMSCWERTNRADCVASAIPGI